MTERERENLTNWVGDFHTEKQSRLKEKRRQQAAEVRQRHDWKRMQARDLDILKNTGSLNAFKDAASVLRKNWKDARVFIEIPKIQDQYRRPNLILQWDIKKMPKHGDLDPTLYEGNEVRLSVKRNDDKMFEGLQFSNKEVVGANPEVISIGLFEAIKNAKRVKIQPQGILGRLKVSFPSNFL